MSAATIAASIAVTTAGLAAGVAATTGDDAVARGTFDVTLTPQAPAPGEGGVGTPMGRLRIDKRFHGDLDGTSVGEMLSAITATKGSAGYVALERVTATLGGRQGTFVLQHSGVMDRGAQRLDLFVIPDSGTDGLAGLTGTMTIDRSGGGHAYVFTYRLP